VDCSEQCCLLEMANKTGGELRNTLKEFSAMRCHYSRVTNYNWNDLHRHVVHRVKVTSQWLIFVQLFILLCLNINVSWTGYVQKWNWFLTIVKQDNVRTIAEVTGLWNHTEVPQNLGRCVFNYWLWMMRKPRGQRYRKWKNFWCKQWEIPPQNSLLSSNMIVSYQATQTVVMPKIAFQIYLSKIPVIQKYQELDNW